MGHPEEFDHIFKDRGGRLDISIVSRELERRLLEFHLARAHSIVDSHLAHLKKIGGKPLSIYVDYVDRDYVNAGASISDNQGYVGIYSGAVYGMYDLFYRVLSHPEFVKGFGDDKSECLRPWHKQGLSRDYGKLIAERPSKYRGLIDAAPHDRLRRMKAESLAACALDFLIVHEITHVINGHCGYYGSFGVTSLFEAGEESEAAKVVPPIERQLMELDADSSAVNFQIINAFIDSRVTRPEVELSRWFFACSLMFFTLGTGRNYSVIFEKNYPQASDRCYMNWLYGLKVLKGITNVDFSSLLTGFVANIFHGCGLISDDSMTTKFVELHFGFNPEKNGEWFRRLAETWQELRPRLLKFSFNPRLLDKLVNLSD